MCKKAILKSISRGSVYAALLVVLVALLSCKNREVSASEGPNFNEIHENIHYHFDTIRLAGSEYFILERDRNNPHEGFGFMALKGDKIHHNQDTLKAYLQTVLALQVEILAAQKGVTHKEAEAHAAELLDYHLKQIPK